MTFTFIADTDIGNVKKTNQDSLLVKHAAYNNKEVLMAILCDGMGGLSSGELASATVIRAFDKWFDQILPFELENPDLSVISGKWAATLKELNADLLKYSRIQGRSMGTTFSGIIFIDDSYLIVHVGDSRVYHLSSGITQITKDQTFVAREIEKGKMTKEQAKTDKRRNMLLQCVGASAQVIPEVIIDKTEPGAYLLCSDGFRHVISEEEIFESLNPVNCINKQAMHSNTRYLIDLVKQRNERDNISAILIKVS
jgi:serine/threonine protein phosphatase PrpC